MKMSNIDCKCFSSARLNYRPISIKDIEDVYDYGKEAETCKFLGWGPYENVDEARAFVEKKIASEDLQWVIQQGTAGKVIGAIRLYDINLEDKTASVSYILGKKYCGCGYMTESLKAMFQIARGLGLRRIYTCFVEENLLSEKVMQRAGMTKDLEYRGLITIKGREYVELRYYMEMR